MSVSNRRRWLVPWKESRTKPAIYHCISRVVDRRFALDVDEREHFRMLMRMCERFTGCRVLSYCVMSNHFHILLEVPPLPAEGISNEELFARLRVFYSEAQVAEIAQEMADAVVVRNRGEFELPPLNELGIPMTEAEVLASAEQQSAILVEAIRSRYTRRMHDLSEFMKSLLERFTRWFNRLHTRTGTLWEDRFKSVIVESGVAARTMAAYIDLNPVRAGMVKEPADYRWSSYGEAIGGGKKGDGKKAREGLVRAYFSDQGVGFDAQQWREVSRLYRRLMGIALSKEPGHSADQAELKRNTSAAKNDAAVQEDKDNDSVLQDLGVVKMLQCRVRYFTDGAVIGSKDFVNEVCASARDRFSPQRKDGARTLKGSGRGAKGLLWSARDLRVWI
jgi:putative transposase